MAGSHLVIYTEAMKRLIFIFFALFLFSSCGKNLTVNLAETALLWRVDDYFDINRDQRKEIKSNFRQALKTVDQNYIPAFEKVIFSNDLITKDCPQIEKSYAQLKPQLEEMRTVLLKQSYSFIDSVKSKQVEYFIDQAKDELAKDEKKSKSDRINKLEKSLKRTQDIMHELFGELSTAQQQSIQDHVLQQKNNEDLILQSRKNNLLLLQSKSETEVKDFMKNYIIQWRDYQLPELKTAMIERVANNEKFYLKFFCLASEKQKKHFQNTVADYLNLVRKVYITQNLTI